MALKCPLIYPNLALMSVEKTVILHQSPLQYVFPETEELSILVSLVA